jgi:hypothetical protein
MDIISLALIVIVQREALVAGEEFIIAQANQLAAGGLPD